MRFLSKRRAALLCAGLGTVGAASAFTFGATSAQYTSTADTQNNTITSGTVALTEDTAQSVQQTITGFMPGDTSQNSKYFLTYAGNDAFVGVDLKITSTAGAACPAYVGSAGPVAVADLLSNCTDTGTVPMFDGDPTSGSLDLSVLPQNGNPAHQLFNPGDLENGSSCSADAAGLVTCTVEKDNVIVPPGSISGGANDLVWHNGTHDFITVKASLPLGASNIFQGSVVHIDLTGHAVQFANNNGPVGSSVGTTLPNGLSGTGGQAAILFPLSWA